MRSGRKAHESNRSLCRDSFRYIVLHCYYPVSVRAISSDSSEFIWFYIEFLRRFYNNDLPFSKRSLSIVKDILILEKTPDYTIRGKTGWVGFDDGVKPQIGWLVGYLEKEKTVYVFATNIEIRHEKDASARMELTRRCLKDLSLL